MTILDEVQSAYQALPLAIREARNISLACVLEPLSNKAGCVTRQLDTNRNTLEMFLSGGINIFPAYYHLTEYLQISQSPEGIYQFLNEAILLSKLNRKGGQINQGILEFSLPIVAAHVLYDPNSEQSPDFLFDKAREVVELTTREDFLNFWKAKLAGRDITFHGRGKTYELFKHEVNSVAEYYDLELKRELESGGHATGIIHNIQFVESFPDIRHAFSAFENASGRISERAEQAYNAVMTKPGNLGIGPGLVADFIAISIYLALTYSKGEEIIS